MNYAKQFIPILTAIIFIVGCKSNDDKISNSVDALTLWDSLDSVQKSTIKEKILNDYFYWLEGDKSFMVNNGIEKGRPISEQDAVLLTSTFYRTYGNQVTDSKRLKAAKSIYFEAQEVIDFLNEVRSKNLCPAGNTLGVRFYLAKYPDTWGVNTPNDPNDDKLQNQQTVIIRAVCNGNDIAHSITGNVAYNFGDVCPPVCNLSLPSEICEGGEYNPNGPFFKECH
jgi:hypothetical protein